MDRDQGSKVKIDIIKGSGIDHIHQIEHVQMLDGNCIVAGEDSQISIGDSVYINGFPFRVTRRENQKENYIYYLT